MCGIFGLISEKWKSDAESAASLISHRGPDDFGIYRDGSLCLIHYRLSILDTSSQGHQPMITDDGRFVIILNGEIYNHLELRQELPDRIFNSGTDTETILYYYARYGVQLFSKLNGIFSMAIYDTVEKELLVARDHIGVKPLYVHHSDSGFVFCSELKSIAVLPEIDKSLDRKSMLKYIQYMYVPGNDTPFQSIKKFEAGHYLRISIADQKILELKKYYQIPFTGSYEQKDEKYWINAIDKALQKVVERQLLSDVPVGYFISGGLDSSLIAAMARKILPDKTLTGFTIKNNFSTNKDGFVDDYPYACQVAEHLNINLEVVDGTLDYKNQLDSIIWQLDEPLTEVSAMYVSSISKLAREKGIYVLLSGMGGDDLFAGYRRHQAIRYLRNGFKIPYFIRNALTNTSAHISVKSARFRRLRKFLQVFNCRDVQTALAYYYKWIDDEIAKNLFLEPANDQLKNYDCSKPFIEKLHTIPYENNLLNKLLFWDIQFFLPDHNLNYTDKMSMKHGVEVRVPYCDIELLLLSTKIPPELKIKNGISKYLLKKVAERYLPKEIIYRSKTGFGGPLREWITGDLSDLVIANLNEKIIKDVGLFKNDKVQNLIAENHNDRIDASYSVFSLMAIHSWVRQFKDISV